MLDGRLRGSYKVGVPGIPRQLTNKRAELAHELAGVLHRAQELRHALGQVDATLRLLDPNYKPSQTKPRKPATSRGWLPHGDAARLCLVVLKEGGKSMTTPEVANRIAEMRNLRFKSRRDSEDFASSIAMALRRYEKKKVVKMVGQRGPHQEYRWQLTVD